MPRMSHSTEQTQLTLVGGRVIDPATGFDQTADVEICNGRIARIGSISKPTGPTFEARGKIVCPGLIDPHVHLREPGQEEKETIATGSAAAVAGGFTSIVCMPNTRPAIDDDGRIEFVYRQAQRANLCRVYPTGAITKNRAGEELAEIGLMAEAGAVAFTDDGDAVASAGVMSKALAYVKMTGRAVMQHCEEPTLVGSGSGGAMNAGPLATRLGLAGRPSVAEELIIQRDVLLNRDIGCKYHVQHLSTAGGVEIIRQARRANMPVTGEVCPHHLLLTENDCATYDTNYKMNPPLRTQRDVDALIQGIADGTLTVLGTDHAPHTREDKELEFSRSPSGILGLECALPLFIKALIQPGVIDWPQLINMMSLAPADLCGLADRGRLIENGDADITVIDPEIDWTIDVNQFKSKSRNCPFHGWDVKGKAIATIVGGVIKYQWADA